MLQEILDSWAKNRGQVTSLEESDLKELIKLEMKGGARKTILEAAHRRQCTLRNAREREALLERAAKRREVLERKAARDGARK